MKEFFRQHGLRILAVAAAIAVALSLLTYFSSTSSVLENIAGVLTYPFRAAATAVSDWAADKRQYYEDTTTLKEENAALKKRSRTFAPSSVRRRPTARKTSSCASF